MREADPLDIVETIREGLLVLEPDLTLPLREPRLLRQILGRARAYGRAKAL